MCAAPMISVTAVGDWKLSSMTDVVHHFHTWCVSTECSALHTTNRLRILWFERHFQDVTFLCKVTLLASSERQLFPALLFSFSSILVMLLIRELVIRHHTTLTLL